MEAQSLLAKLLNLLELEVQNRLEQGLKILLGQVHRLHHLGLLGQVQNLLEEVHQDLPVEG